MRISPNATDQSVEIHLVDADGHDKTDALAADLTCYYRRGNGPLVAVALHNLSAITDVHSDGGLIHVADGSYRLDLPDLALAAGVDTVNVYLSGDGILQTAGPALIQLDAPSGGGGDSVWDEDEKNEVLADLDVLKIRTASGAKFVGPLNKEGTVLATVRGDDYTADSPHGPLTWNAPASTYGDLTGATIAFTSRKADDDEAEIDGYAEGSTVLNAGTESQQVQIELPASETVKLTPGANGKRLTNKFDVQVTRADDVVFTLAHGEPPKSGHTITEDQTRPA